MEDIVLSTNDIEKINIIFYLYSKEYLIITIKILLKN